MDKTALLTHFNTTCRTNNGDFNTTPLIVWKSLLIRGKNSSKLLYGSGIFLLQSPRRIKGNSRWIDLAILKELRKKQINRQTSYYSLCNKLQLSIYLFIYLSIYLSIYLIIYLSIYYISKKITKIRLRVGWNCLFLALNYRALWKINPQISAHKNYPFWRNHFIYSKTMLACLFVTYLLRNG